jgi:hypothetical protein
VGDPATRDGQKIGAKFNGGPRKAAPPKLGAYFSKDMCDPSVPLLLLPLIQ